MLGKAGKVSEYVAQGRFAGAVLGDGGGYSRSAAELGHLCALVFGGESDDGAA
jgi:hypothetical protein